ncbi:MAG: hypothetical protein M3N98_05635 [Actinomycetota bacterium]|nr:hypothetical protein [Actinomycetota bacterium]
MAAERLAGRRKSTTGLRPRLPYLGLVVAAWAALPRFVSPPFHTRSANEVADHLVPAVVVLAVSLGAHLAARHGRQSGPGMLLGGLVIMLAGLWMCATHLPLLVQALRHTAPWPATVHHVAAAIGVFAVGATWAVLYWNPLLDDIQPP